MMKGMTGLNAVNGLWLVLALYSSGLVASDITVDLNQASSPCTAMREAMRSYILENVRGNQTSLVIRGKARISLSDLTDIGDYSLCAGLGPGLYEKELAAEVDLPKKIKLYGSITFDDVYIELDSSHQKKPAVLFQFGSAYNYGSNGNNPNMTGGTIHTGGVIQGVLTMRLNVQAKPILDEAAQLPSLPFGDKNLPRRTVVGVFESGIHRTDMTKLSLTIESKQKDNDDIGILHQHSWGVRRGPTRIEKLGIGALFYGNSVGSISNSYIHRNNIGIMLGDFKNGGDLVYATDCLHKRYDKNSRDACESIDTKVTGLVVSDSVIEGNSFGNLVVNDASMIDFRSVHFEMPMLPYQRGHGILIGGGLCNSEALRLYGDRGECGKSGTKAKLKKAMIDGVRFEGGFIDNDRGSSTWNAVVIGENAKVPQGNAGSSNFVFNTYFRESRNNSNRKTNILGNAFSKSMLIKSFGSKDIRIDFSGSRYQPDVVEVLFDDM